ncbi:MAG: hypothetical protein ACOY3I_06695 [Verrucomicrobiota bacterium]
MINLGELTTRQDIKTDELVHKPAPNVMLIFVLAFYIVILFFAGRAIWEIVPVASIAVDAKNIEIKASQAEAEGANLEAKIKHHEMLKTYVQKKEIWANTSLGAGDILEKIFRVLPEDVKLRGLDYTYQPPVGQNPGIVKIAIKIRGTYEAGRVLSVVRQVDSRLGVVNNKQNVTEQGTELELEYQVNR